jgi:hypothetical protein
MGRFWNQKRLQNYPRLIFIGLWLVMAINLIFHHGWSGRFGGVIGVDFISSYSSGIQYRTDIKNLYSIQAQYEAQQAIYQQEEFIGQYSTYVSPPYVALLNSLFTFLPFGYAFLGWTILSVAAGLLSVFLIQRYLIPISLDPQLSYFQLFIIIFGFPPLVFGLLFGQNHLITFLLLTGVVIMSLKGRWFSAGLLIGLISYKPHVIIGFLIVFLLRKKLGALIGCALVTGALVGIVIIQHGYTSFVQYFTFLSSLVNNYHDLVMLETTAFALIASATYDLIKNYIPSIIPYWMLCVGFLFGGLLSNKQVKSSPRLDLILATLVLYIISPHLLIYDILPVMLVILLLANEKPSLKLVMLAIITFISPVILAGLSKYVGISLLGLLPIYLCYVVIRNFVFIPKNRPAEFVLI